MNKHILTKLIALAFVCYFHSAQAAIISVKLPGDTSTYSTTVGSEFDANIYINSVADFAGFDFNLIYNTGKLSALTLTSGSIFGAADTETFASSIVPGTVHFAEAISSTSSLLAGLNINAPTLLGTIHFKALATTGAVNSPLTITNPILSDFNGNSLAGSIQTANVAITPAPVPLPASALLFAPGLLALFGLRKNKAQNLAI
jgi:hypothetical protein